MKSRMMIGLILAVVVMLTLVSCGPLPSEAATLPSEDGTSNRGPLDVVMGFYADYLAYESNPLVDGWYHTHEAVSPEWAAAVDEILASFDKGGYDPFLCAQDKPERVLPALASLSEDEAVVDVETTFEGHAFVVELRRADDGWHIVGVTCSPPENPTGGDVAEGWQSFRDEVYGFEFRYPATWTTEEVDINAPGRPPAGKMDRLVHLMPSNWNEDFTPLFFEVYTLSDEAFQVEHVPGDARDEIDVNGVLLVKEVYDYRDFYAVQYTFECPTQENLRVVWYDYFTGWPDRVEGNEDIAELLEPILASFRFTG